MDHFDPYDVSLAIATNITAAYDCFCAPGTHMIMLNKSREAEIMITIHCAFLVYGTQNTFDCSHTSKEKSALLNL